MLQNLPSFLISFLYRASILNPFFLLVLPINYLLEKFNDKLELSNKVTDVLTIPVRYDTHSLNLLPTKYMKKPVFVIKV